MSSRPHHRPTQRDAGFFDDFVGGVDPAAVSEAADRAAWLLVRGARESDDDAVADRLQHLADTEGIEAIAEVWSGSPADSLAGCLWRLYLLRSWVYADPGAFARVVATGRAGLPDPSDQDVRRMLVLAEQLEAAGHIELERGLA